MNEEKKLITIEEKLSVEQVSEQIISIQQLMNKLMRENEHYGVIPGTKKPTLYKAGAEKLCLMFRLAPQYKIDRRDLGNGHVDYIIECRLTNIQTGQFWGQGVGSCSTMESKYRYRNDVESTGQSVLKEYWDNRDIRMIGGKGHIVKKDENEQWKIFKKSGRIENPDIADQWNTVLKMAKKRALVDAAITATAASDIFYQDLEDLKDNFPQETKSDKQIIFEKAQDLIDANADLKDVCEKLLTSGMEKKYIVNTIHENKYEIEKILSIFTNFIIKKEGENANNK